MEPAESGAAGSPPDEIELTGCGATLCCDPRRSVHRFVVLPLICFIGFGEWDSADPAVLCAAKAAAAGGGRASLLSL